MARSIINAGSKVLVRAISFHLLTEEYSIFWNDQSNIIRQDHGSRHFACAHADGKTEGWETLDRPSASDLLLEVLALLTTMTPGQHCEALHQLLADREARK